MDSARSTAPRTSAASSSAVGNTWGGALRVVAGVALGGFALDCALGRRPVPAPDLPDSAYLFAALFALQLVLWWTLRGTRVLACLKGSRLAVASLALLGAMALLPGIFPQDAGGEAVPIHARVLDSAPFIAALLLLLTNLALALFDHLAGGLGWSSLFLLNHAGVYLAVAGGMFGAGSVVRLDVWVKEGELAWTGETAGRRQELPFAVHLHRFSIEHFPPELALMDAEHRGVLSARKQDMLLLRSGVRARFQGHQVSIGEVTLAAPWSAEGEAVPAAKVRVTNDAGETTEGWVSAGAPRVPPVFVGLGRIAFGMAPLRPRSYESELTLVLPGGKSERRTLRVNEPLRFEGWWLYQKGFDLENAPAVRLSQLEAVRDPWLPVVYTGFALLALGSLTAMAKAGALLRGINSSGGNRP